jgi:hypothetical protein
MLRFIDAVPPENESVVLYETRQPLPRMRGKLTARYAVLSSRLPCVQLLAGMRAVRCDLFVLPVQTGAAPGIVQVQRTDISNAKVS